MVEAGFSHVPVVKDNYVFTDYMTRLLIVFFLGILPCTVHNFTTIFGNCNSKECLFSC